MIGVDTGAMRNDWDIVGRSQSYDSSSLFLSVCVYVCMCVCGMCVFAYYS